MYIDHREAIPANERGPGWRNEDYRQKILGTRWSGGEQHSRVYKEDGRLDALSNSPVTGSCEGVSIIDLSTIKSG